MAAVRLSEAEWRARAAAHEARVDGLTAEHRARRAAGTRHPVDDFLWDYYGHAPAKLRRWHPGAGFVLENAAADERATWAYMRVIAKRTVVPASKSLRDHGPFSDQGDGAAGEQHGAALHAAAGEQAAADAHSAAGDVALDLDGFMENRGRTVGFVRRMLENTLGRPMHTGCFGLHEWAMVYRDAAAARHEGYELRLGQEGTDAVLEASTLRCTHFDATRFFTTGGAERNTLAPTPTRAMQVDQENAGCVHAGMDLYKWAFKLAPALPSELSADAFELARELRTLDMQAAPYDLTALGYEPVRIETPQGRQEYASRQRELGERGNVLRRRLLGALDALDAAASRQAASPRWA